MVSLLENQNLRELAKIKNKAPHKRGLNYNIIILVFYYF